MNHFSDAKKLIEYSKVSLEKIKDIYDKSLDGQEIKPNLLIEIKSFMENLRSALDFTAYGLFERYGDPNSKNKVYFPYASTDMDKAAYLSKRVINKIPGLEANRPDIAKVIEGYQQFSSNENSWLPTFMELNNESKHQRLIPQVRKETRQLNIRSGGATMSIGEGGTINIAEGAFIRMGDSIIPGGQIITSKGPANIIGPATQEIMVWVSFHFSTNNEAVIPLLEKSLRGIEAIVNKLARM